MPFLRSITHLLLFALPALATSAKPIYLSSRTFVCGYVELWNNSKQPLYVDACYKIKGVARTVSFEDGCNCELFRFDSCNARRRAVGEDNVPVEEAKGYFCQFA